MSTPTGESGGAPPAEARPHRRRGAPGGRGGGLIPAGRWQGGGADEGAEPFSGSVFARAPPRPKRRGRSAEAAPLGGAGGRSGPPPRRPISAAAPPAFPARAAAPPLALRETPGGRRAILDCGDALAHDSRQWGCNGGRSWRVGIQWRTILDCGDAMAHDPRLWGCNGGRSWRVGIQWRTIPPRRQAPR